MLERLKRSLKSPYFEERRETLSSTNIVRNVSVSIKLYVM